MATADLLTPNLFGLAYACRLYAQISAYDASLEEFRRTVGSTVDLSKAQHCKALIRWLNSWGCRHLSKKSHPMTTKVLQTWFPRHAGHLPALKQDLTDLGSDELDALQSAYDDLESKIAATRLKRGKPEKVRFGATATSKTLYALRPHTVPPSDKGIREKLAVGTYRAYLEHVAKCVVEIRKEASRLGIDKVAIPEILGRDQSSLPKLVDEYFWIVHTRGLDPPSTQDLKQWCKWIP